MECSKETNPTQEKTNAEKKAAMGTVNDKYPGGRWKRLLSLCFSGSKDKDESL